MSEDEKQAPPPQAIEWLVNPLGDTPSHIAVYEGTADVFLKCVEEFKAANSGGGGESEGAADVVLLGPDNRPLKQVHLKSQSNPGTYMITIPMGSLIIGADLLSQKELETVMETSAAISAQGEALKNNKKIKQADRLQALRELSKQEQGIYLGLLDKCKGFNLKDAVFSIDLLREDLVLPDIITIGDEIINRSQNGRTRFLAS